MRNALILIALLLIGCSKDVIKSTTTDLTASNGKSLKTLTTGNVYYVDPAGNDASDGLSTGTAWKTLAKVDSTTFSPGDQLLFKCGSSWAGRLQPKGSGISGSPIVIDMYGSGSKPLINGNGTNGATGLTLSNQSYWEVNNLEITNTQTVGGTSVLRGIAINSSGSGAVNHVYIQNCYVHDVNAVGVGGTNYSKASGGIIYSGYFNDVLVKNCHVANCAVEGIRNTASATLSTNIIFQNNLVENVYGDGIVMSNVASGCVMSYNTVHNACTTNAANFAGIWTYNSTGTVVSHNEVYGLTGGNIDGQAFDADLTTNGDTFEYNYSHDNARGFMLFMPSSTNIVVRYNVSVNDCTGGTKFFNYLSTNTTNKIYNNTFYLGNNITQIFQTGFNSMFNNNIIYATGTVTKFCSATVSSSSTFKNNCFYPSTIISTNGPAGTVSGNIFTDPQFATTGAHGTGMSAATAYIPNSNSPCYNTGIFINYDGGVDYSHNYLPAGLNPDMGAFQHNAATSSLISSADTYVRDGTYAATNYGTETSTTVKSDAVSYNRKAYSKFDFTAVTTPQIQTAILSMNVSYTDTDPSRTISVYTTNTESWLESTLNWNTAPMDTTYVGKLTVTGTGVYTLDVSSAINRQLARPDHIASFLFLNKGATGAKNDIMFNTRRSASNKPQLSITY
ncbi:MAG: DNRLRE domain-containing protein [Bacteroidota bacterium]